MTSPRLAEETGRVLGGRYRVIAPVGVGTSSRVFMAVDTQLRRRVAVKLLHEALAEDEAFLRRFRAEARAAGALNHPNIVAVFDWGEDRADDGAVVPFLVTEFLGGGSLRDVLDRGEPLTPSQALVVGLDAARALTHAHLRGLVHRDVKPGNLLFDDEGRLRLADFGLARALAEASWTEPTGSAVGTARYASPEQALGRRLDGRSDVYSLALVLVECLTGRVPFTGDTTAATLALRTQGDLELGPELDGLRSVIERAGRLDPDERPEAAELEISLMAAAERLPRPEPLPIVPTLGEGEETSELFLVREIDVLPASGAAAPTAGAAEPTVLEPDEPTVLDEPAVGAADPDAAPAFREPSRDPILVAEEHDRLTGSRPASFGRVEPLVAPPDETPGESPRRRRRGRKVLAVLAVLAVVGGAAAGWWFGIRIPVHEVPDLSGMDVQDARAIAEDLGFVLDDETRGRRDGSEPGDVLSQTPAAGEELAEGETLSITVSLGPTLTPLPDVVGAPEAEARAAIETAGLVVAGATPAHDEEAEVGVVLTSTIEGDVEPDGEGRVPKGTEVSLVVSAGPAPRVVPGGLDGASRADAVAAVEALQLVADVSEEFSETVRAGVVVSSSPAQGVELERGAAVSLVVSKGPAPIPVPDVRYITGSMAAQRLEEAGFTVAGIEGSPTGMVLATDPVAGELHQRGTAIRLFTRS